MDQYGCFEMMLTYDGHTVADFDGSVTATFRHDDGQTVTVNGYYAGQDRYGVRFMPMKTGTWEYRVESHMPFAERLEGTVAVEAGERKGPLRRDPQHPHHFITASGQRFFPLGNTAYNLLATQLAQPDAAWQFLKHYGDRKFNWFRFWLQQTTWPTADLFLWPFGGTADEPDFDTFNLDLFAAAEQSLIQLADLGAVGSVILLHPADDVWDRVAQPRRLAIIQRYFDYAVARLAAYDNLVWCVANEWRRGENFTPTEIEALGDHLRHIDPYDHLIAVHHYGRFEFPYSDWVDMSSMQHRGLPHAIHDTARVNRAFGKPVLNEEYGYEQDTIQPPNDPVNVRRDHWALTMAGAYGAYGDKTKGPKVSVYFSSNLADAQGTQAPDWLGHIRTIMEQSEYWKMAPCPEILSGCIRAEVFCLAQLGREYLVYCCVGQDVTLELKHLMQPEIAYTWFDPRTGDPVEDGERDLEPQSSGYFFRYATFTPPDYVHDWVLRVLARPQR